MTHSVTDDLERLETRRGVLSRAAVALVAGGLLAPAATVRAKDYASRREALDDIDRLAAACGIRLGALGGARPGARNLVVRFLAALEGHRATREEVRTRFGLPRGLDPASQVGEAEAGLEGLRQALDDLMIAYAESLPVYGDSFAVARLAECMVEVSRLRTVIDLWAVSEGA
jgi:hypothetical protein